MLLPLAGGGPCVFGSVVSCAALRPAARSCAALRPAAPRAPPSALFAVAFVGLGIAVATAYAASLVVSLTKAAHRGAKTGIHHSLVGIGSVFAPFLAGYISVEISTSAAYLACIGLIGLALAGQWLLARAARESRAVAGVKGARSDR